MSRWSSIVSIVEASTTRGLPDRDAFLGSVKAIDPLGRPLFAALAADAWAAGRDVRDWDRDALLRDVLQRENESYWKPGGVREKDRNLLAVATLTGGLLVEDLTALQRISRDLPTLDADDPDRFDARRYELFVSHDSRDWLAPLEPDLIGEFFVLEHLTPKDGGDTVRRMSLNVVAWLARASGVFAFTTRAVQDFPEHAGLSIVTRSGDVVVSMLDDFSVELRDELLFHLPATLGNLLHFDCEHMRIDSARARLEQLHQLSDRWPESQVLQSVAISMTVVVVVTLLRAGDRSGAQALSTRLAQRIGGRIELAVLAIRVFGLRAGVLAESGAEDVANSAFEEACAFMAACERHDSLLAALTEAARVVVHGLIEKRRWPAAAAVFFRAAALLGNPPPAPAAGPFGLAAADLLLNGIGNSLADFETYRREYAEIYTLCRPVVWSEAFDEGLRQRHEAEADEDRDEADAEGYSSAHVAGKFREVFDAVGKLLHVELPPARRRPPSKSRRAKRPTK